MTPWSQVTDLKLEADANHVHFCHLCHIFLDQLQGFLTRLHGNLSVHCNYSGTITSKHNELVHISDKAAVHNIQYHFSIDIAM